MMKILLLALNSRYVHPNLALGYLSEIAKEEGHEVDLKEYTINMQPREILLDSDFENYEVICFSVYIWNGDFVKKLLREMRMIHPEGIYLCGGPEVMGRPMDYLCLCDGVVMGEGESPFRSFLKNPGDSSQWKSISTKGYLAPINREEILDFPYPHSQTKNKTIVYYEAQRGCPFSCSYCMSGSTGVRYRPMELVKKDLLLLIESEIPLVKFVDRSFNVHLRKSLEIIEYIKDRDRGKTSFHMELAPNLLGGELIEALKGVREDLFQVEIGIQSTDDEVNKKVYRSLLYSKYKEELKEFIKAFPGHVHLDLISGLPGTTFENIRKSHLELESLGGDFIQLGFLKLMPGTKLFEEREIQGILASSFAPYEVLKTVELSYSELKLLKIIERMMDLYPKEDIPISFEYLSRNRGAFDVYHWMAQHFPKDKIYHRHSLENKLEILGDFSGSLIKETLELDYAKKRRNRRFLFFPGRKSPGGESILSYYDGEGLAQKSVNYRIDYEKQLLCREERDV
jgi:radical SAM superfamily enzyme YgiQ (UPF0313 family)